MIDNRIKTTTKLNKYSTAGRSVPSMEVTDKNKTVDNPTAIIKYRSAVNNNMAINLQLSHTSLKEEFFPQTR